MTLGEDALAYAAQGWPVIPCHTWDGRHCSCGRADCPHPAKHPRTAHGLHDATTDLEQVAVWWDRWPQANIGIRTGVQVDVIDVDTDAGLEGLTSASGGRPLGWGPIARTGKGWHYYLACGGRRSKIRFLPGVDLKADDAYVIAPPSIHQSGRQYRWFQDCGPDYRTPQPAPAWLAPLLDPPARTPAIPVSERLSSQSSGGRYALAALRSEAASVANAAKGSRNDTLNLAAFRMRRFVESGDLVEGDVLELLLSAAVLSGLGGLEAERTIRSGLGAGT
jgi:hypothetical protein